MRKFHIFYANTQQQIAYGIQKHLKQWFRTLLPRAHVQLSSTRYQDTLARTTKKKQLEHCPIYIEIGTIYESS